MAKRSQSTGRYLTADLKCWICCRLVGHIAGPVVRPGLTLSLNQLYFRVSIDGAWTTGVPISRQRCPRCGGLLRLEDIEYPRLQPDALAPWMIRPIRSAAAA